jgi:hypothetical protein
LSFKNEAAYQQAEAIIRDAKFKLDPVAIANGLLGKGFVEYLPVPAGAERKPTMNTDTNQSLVLIADSLFDTMVATGRAGLGGWAQDLAIVLKQADIASKTINRQRELSGASGRPPEPIDVFGPLTTSPANRPGMGGRFRTMGLTPGKDNDKWVEILKIITPTLLQASALTIAKSPAPAAAAKPGTAAPIKKN